MFAVLGVALGVGALATVISVTGGFRAQFREKVLGVNAHVLILKYSSDFREYRKLMEQMKGVPGVIGIAPFVISPMMITHGDRTATGVLLKGVDPSRVKDVLDLPRHISLYTAFGRSKTTTDSRNSLNQGYGITFANIGKTGLLVDAHYSKFDSSFGSGQYESISVSKSLTDALHLQVMGGMQKFNSPFSTNSNAKFVNGVVDYSFGRRYFIEGNIGWYQGSSLNYTQWSTTLGYRFGGLRH